MLKLYPLHPPHPLFFYCGGYSADIIGFCVKGYLLHFSSLQRHALEQRHYPKGLCGVHKVAAEGAAACSGTGEPPEEAGASEQETAAEDPGNNTEVLLCLVCFNDKQ